MTEMTTTTFEVAMDELESADEVAAGLSAASGYYHKVLGMRLREDGVCLLKLEVTRPAAWTDETLYAALVSPDTPAATRDEAVSALIDALGLEEF